MKKQIIILVSLLLGANILNAMKGRDRQRKILQPMMNQPQRMMNQLQRMMGQPQRMMNQPQRMMPQPQQMMQPRMMGQPQRMMNQPQRMMNQPQRMMNQPRRMMNQPQRMMNQPQRMMNQPQRMMNQPMMGQQPHMMMYQPQRGPFGHIVEDIKKQREEHKRQWEELKRQSEESYEKSRKEAEEQDKEREKMFEKWRKENKEFYAGWQKKVGDIFQKREKRREESLKKIKEFQGRHRKKLGKYTKDIARIVPEAKGSNVKAPNVLDIGIFLQAAKNIDEEDAINVIKVFNPEEGKPSSIVIAAKILSMILKRSKESRSPLSKEFIQSLLELDPLMQRKILQKFTIQELQNLSKNEGKIEAALLEMEREVLEQLQEGVASTLEVKTKLKFIEGKLFIDPTIFSVIVSIMQEEAAIISAPLMRTLLYILKIKKSNVKIKMDKWTKNMLFSQDFDGAISRLFDGKNWFVYKAADSEFAVLIPRSKYQGAIQGRSLNLAKIGLNPAALQLIYPRNLEREFQASLQMRRDTIEFGILNNIFLKTENAKKINKRVILNGHGIADSIANLTIEQYARFLQLLVDINCSVCVVLSCYAGGLNADKARKEFAKQAGALQKFIELPFILAVAGIPDATIKKWDDVQYDTFFRMLNVFFQIQREQLERMYPKELVEKMSEQDTLTGITLPKNIPNLVRRDPKIIKQFSPILRYLVGYDKTNFPFIKFPGERFYRPATKMLKEFDVHSLLINQKFLDEHQADRVLNLEKKGYVDILLESLIVPKPIEIYAQQVFPNIYSVVAGNAGHYMQEMAVDLGSRLANRLPIILTKFQPIETSTMKAFLMPRLRLKNAVDETGAFVGLGPQERNALRGRDIILENVLIVRAPQTMLEHKYQILFMLNGQLYRGVIGHNQTWKDLRFAKTQDTMLYSFPSVLQTPVDALRGGQRELDDFRKMVQGIAQHVMFQQMLKQLPPEMQKVFEGMSPEQIQHMLQQMLQKN